MINCNLKSSRRAFSLMLAAATLSPRSSAANQPSDAELLALEKEYETVSERLHVSIISGTEEELNIAWDAVNSLRSEIFDRQAMTLAGLQVKARLVSGSQSGDFSRFLGDADEMMLSITRDLIRMSDPHLEKPGEIERIYENIEVR